MAKELQQRQNEIEEQIQSCKAKEERRNKRKHLTVTENSVADIVSDWTKIPVTETDRWGDKTPCCILKKNFTNV